MKPVTRKTRLLHFLIDWPLIVLVSYVLFMVYMFGTIGHERLGDAEVAWYFIYLATYFLYYFLLEGIFGFTVGKLCTRTRLENNGPGKPSLSQLLKRTFIRMFSIDWLSFIHSRSGHHDLLSDTRLVRKKRIKKMPSSA